MVKEYGRNLMYYTVLFDAIKREREGKDYFYNDVDKFLLRTMLDEINNSTGSNYRYLAELDMLTIPGIGEIVLRYIRDFSSQSVKGYLLHHLVSDKVKDCDKLVLDMYDDFKISDAYIPAPGRPASASIYIRYDDAIKRLKPKRLKDNLIKLAYQPRDFFYLPFTMRMLASWKIPEMKDILIRYSSNQSISGQEVGLMNDVESYFPPFSFISREIRFTAIEGLKNYQSEEVARILQKYIADSDSDIRAAAKKTLQKWKTGDGLREP